ncbi:MAG TPA: RNA 2',3'-cyclic phosphodiesterase [Candidatus Pacearchaeota archaeon]|nr:RNA 2',3'-cyclic phosphodiesterase [Candidatus Pacearchaeota archaeon]
MKHRVFIAINLPSSAKSELAKTQKVVSAIFDEQCPIKWEKPEKLHITVAFLGYLTDQQEKNVGELLYGLSRNCEKMELAVEKIEYGPPNIFPPRLLWARLRENSALRELHGILAEGLGKIGINLESKDFIGHITLGRISQWAFKSLDPQCQVDVAQDLELKFRAESLDLMESKLGRGGSVYSLKQKYILRE